MLGQKKKVGSGTDLGLVTIGAGNGTRTRDILLN
jgi:hypothetical protein